MGVFTIAYESNILPNIYKAIDNALENEVKDVALQSLEFSAMHDVYMAYTPDPFFQESRRYSFMQDESYDCSVANNTLTITSNVKPQNLFSRVDSSKWSNADLATVVTEGNVSWGQPFPRPWMDSGIESNLGSIESALIDGMKRQGF